MGDPHHSPLQLDRVPPLRDGRLIIAFDGWMDGGSVSTGTVRRLVERLDAEPVGGLDPEGFYVHNMPGDMTTAAMFRPSIEIEDGLVVDCDMPDNAFFATEQHRLLLFVGHEPNLRWRTFADAVFEACRACGVRTIYFVGSFGGSVPHTREPRLYVSASTPELVNEMEGYGAKPSQYDGPGSFSTYLTTRAPAEGIEMINLVAEIPGYLQGINPMSIEAVARRLAKVLEVDLDLPQLRAASTKWELKVTAAVEEDEDLAAKVRELERQYDDELIGVAAEEGGGADEHDTAE